MTHSSGVNRDWLYAYIKNVKLAGAKGFLLGHLEARAIELQQRLESLWHHWDNAGEKLIHPLNGTDKIKGSLLDGTGLDLLNERRDFMVLYLQHLDILKAEFPEFSSTVVETGYPADYEYQQVLANLRNHIENLKDESMRAWGRH